MTSPPVQLSVVIPASHKPPTLEACVEAVERALRPGDELIVVTDPPGRSPARLRNVGAQRAHGDVLVFVDSDVTVHEDALDRMRAAFDADPGLAAAFGSYDETPPGGMVAKFRNLLHHHVHQQAAGEAETFWGGLGGVRRDVFLAAGGFDDRRYPRPMLEDVELGLRLTDDGHRIALLPDVLGRHLKNWNLRAMVRTDLVDRGVPWMRLLLERRSAPAVLNLGWRHRLSALALALLPILAILGLWIGVAAAAAVFIGLNLSFYALLLRRIGPHGALAGVLLHALHHALAIGAVGLGVVVHLRRSHALPRPVPLTRSSGSPVGSTGAARERR